MALSRIVFGLVVPAAGSEIGERIDELVQSLGKRTGILFERRDAASYEALAADVRDGHTDVAWLPPIVFVRLGDIVTPLGSVLRGADATYQSALIVRASSHVDTIDGLRGLRAGWVDRWSAAGFVLPRVNLALLGSDPRRLFRTETFHGSHRGVVEALMSGACDVAGTHARADDSGAATSGAWSEIGSADVRVVATFGAIPPDVIVVRSAVKNEVQGPALEALRGLAAEQTPLLRAIFGGDVLREGLAPGYDALKQALETASSQGLFGEV